jgi:hypothetical protein
MKKHLVILASVIVGFTLATARAQPGPRGGMGGGPTGPSFDGAMAKLFGDNTGFSANLEVHTTRASGKEAIIPGKVAFLEGKSRFEMDPSSMHGGDQQGLANAKQMGLDKMIMINRRDKHLSYTIYPGMQAYLERPIPQATADANNTAADYKTEVTKLGQETIDGHDCIKNQVVVTGTNGATHESTVWNATDLKNFPVKIQTSSKSGQTTVMLFKDVKLDKPDLALFDPPAGYKKYDDVTSLMMSRFGGQPPK